MKKQLLTIGALSMFTIGSIFAQNKISGAKITLGNNNPQNVTRCSTQEPGAEWDNWFNSKVEEFKANNAKLKAQGIQTMPSYTIPVVVHVIHSNEAVGTASNISQAQVQDQINILNADYAGTGLNSGSVPSAFSALKADCQITFCLALTDPSGNTLAEPGIHRVPYTSITGLSAPGSGGYSSTTIDNTIKPNTIWDPVKYCNMWTLKIQTGLLGYATFPAGSTLTGIPGGTGTINTDGVVMGHNYFGSIGSAAGAAPYNKGRTTTHEVGHWLGLRHIWGDSNCGNDYCTDTPPQPDENYGCPTHPLNVGSCTGNTAGEMFMNFMDYTDDACMYMFTTDQKARMQTCMANGTYRKFLGTHGLCNSTPVAPTANFNIAATGCNGQAVSSTNNSTGSPSPTFAWSASPSAGVTFSPSSTSATPTITFTNNGTYTITLVATNGSGSNNATDVITITTCAAVCDTIGNFDLATHTPSVYLSGGTGAWGYTSGHNNYDDYAKAEKISGIPAGYSVTGGIFLFATAYDAAPATSLNAKVWDDNGTGGLPGTSALGTVALPISSMQTGGTATLVTFASPIAVTGDFYLGIDGLVNGANQDTVALIVNADGETSPATAYEQWGPGPGGAWYAFDNASSWQSSQAYAIFAIVCPTVGGKPEILNNSSEVILFPNPTDGLLYVSYNAKNQDNISIKVYNTLGAVVSTKEIASSNGGTFEVDLSNMPKGVYYVSVSDSNRTVTKKLVLNK